MSRDMTKRAYNCSLVTPEVSVLRLGYLVAFEVYFDWHSWSDFKVWRFFFRIRCQNWSGLAPYSSLTLVFTPPPMPA